MSSKSPRQTHYALHLTLLVFVVWCCCGLDVGTYAQPAPLSVNLNLRISVVDKESGTPVDKAQIHIPRQGINVHGQTLQDIDGTTDANGEFTKPDAGFQLTGTPHKLIIKAKGYQPLELEIPDSVLRETFNNKEPLSMGVALASFHNISSPSNTNLETETGSDTPNQKYLSVEAPDGGNRSNPGPVMQTFSLLNFVLWGLGILSIILIGTTIWAWRSGYRPRRSRSDAKVVSGKPTREPGVTSTEIYLKEITERIRLLERASGDERAEAKRLMEAVREIHSLLSTVYMQTTIDTSTAGPPSLNVAHVSPRPSQNNRKVNSTSRDDALSKYRALIHRQPLNHKPLYVEADAKSSPAGKLADNSIYLLQVGNNQTTFVLFPDEASGDKTGWVFPNPLLVFNPLCLCGVFPQLTEMQFTEGKEQIKPVRVSRVDEQRWKVDGSEDRL